MGGIGWLESGEGHLPYLSGGPCKLGHTHFGLCSIRSNLQVASPQFMFTQDRGFIPVNIHKHHLLSNTSPSAMMDEVTGEMSSRVWLKFQTIQKIIQYGHKCTNIFKNHTM